MNKIWQNLLFSWITITMSIKDGMKIDRYVYNYKRQ